MADKVQEVVERMVIGVETPEIVYGRFGPLPVLRNCRCSLLPLPPQTRHTRTRFLIKKSYRSFRGYD